jgi:chromosome segregation ATPase
MAAQRIAKDDEIAKLRAHYDILVADGLEKLKVMTDKFLRAEKEISTLTATIRVLETEIITFKDVTEQLNMSRANAETIFAEKAKLQDELDAAAEYINDLEAKFLKSQETSIELLTHLKNAEFEIETLKQYIIDLKSRIAVYIPVKNDLVDKKLAEYINNFPDRQKLKIMFMRESDGVY